MRLAFTQGHRYEWSIERLCYIYRVSTRGALLGHPDRSVGVFQKPEDGMALEKKLTNLCQATAVILQYINDFYNSRRWHSYLEGISPLAFEARVA